MSLTKKLFLIENKFLIWANKKTTNKAIALLARNVSRIGDGFVYVIVSLLAYFFAGEAGKAFFWTSLFAYSIELSLYLILKNTIKRPRPNNLAGLNALIKPSDTFSFPSGHTAGAFVYATIVTFFVPLLSVLAFFVALCIGLSRILLGVHYPTDIFAGAVLGFSTAIFVLFMQGFL